MKWVIDRKRGERIVIGDSIIVEIGRVRDSGVTIAIDAPKDVRVDRTEVRAAKEMAS